ncbi:phosphoadenosine phosphosulfate reductase family protein [Cupriavidus sp. IK-TO18]|uniref:phosphoadenosine phosphosulfate reductase domain-containing protein n=1 Tax=Cupriavidus sp. IK-TO18 TaxID=2782182 RepID=UPI0018985077|nr:phosphoadenosine phosphosulfate reductase family protein [Cupriavidus sp. IK-TO18]MBF6987227.1 phosphoadenosine phosphosulfate reductase family protein [Cupriavidus sp. IK-TO18]
MSLVHVVSMSGGKDSTATAILALEQHGKDACRFVFADTGNEHEVTYEYLHYLESALGIAIDWVRRDFSDIWWPRRDYVRDVWPTKGVPDEVIVRALEVFERGPTGIPFLDLCIIKARFPSRMAQFCTHELKVAPITEYQMSVIDYGNIVWSWQGVRIEESEARRTKFQGSGACVVAFDEVGGGLYNYRPILRWGWQDVFEAHRLYNVKPNPLYLQGRDRVGCLCINSGKQEIGAWAKRDRHHIERIAEWEDIVSAVSKRANATFFPAPGDNDTARERGGIWQKVEWAKTTRGGRQFSLLDQLEEPTACSSAYGLCE